MKNCPNQEEKLKNCNYDLIIIGAGPAGLTAALYAGRYRLNTLVLEKLSPGGQIILSSTIENYPGFPGGIETNELISRFKKQVDELGVEIVSDEVVEVGCVSDAAPPIYTVKTNEAEYAAKSLIISSGARSKPLNVEGETRLIGRGISYCGTCDGPMFKNKDIFVVGGGDRAIEEALFLSTYAHKVTIIHRRQEFRASAILLEKAKKNERINFVLDSTIESINGKDRIESITVHNTKTERTSELLCSGVFIFIGIEPNTGYLGDFITKDKLGFVVTDDELKTNRKGVFACGDCRKKSLYQVVNACGEAAVAAHSAHGYLLNL
ncbi:MAG: thioredoxin-disulfide reductase [Candidatus Omnitrophota bacterium]